MKHSFSVSKYTTGLEDGYAYRTSSNQADPFIYDDRGRKQYVRDGDYIAIQGNYKTVVHKEAVKYAKYI